MPDLPWFDLEAFRQDAKLHGKKLHKNTQATHLIPIEQAVQDVERRLGSSLVTLRTAASTPQKNTARLKLNQHPDLVSPPGVKESTWVRLYITEDHLQIMAQMGPLTEGKITCVTPCRTRASLDDWKPCSPVQLLRA